MGAGPTGAHMGVGRTGAHMGVGRTGAHMGAPLRMDDRWGWGCSMWKIHATIGEVVAGKKPGRTSLGERILCVPIGTGAMDIAVAAVAYERAAAKGLGGEYALVWLGLFSLVGCRLIWQIIIRRPTSLRDS
ncbi:MAG: hypothetical protein HY712_03670 [candidate division NC10 bacterium]|nr:hypothetical protein [candidate division NC10 bacterium]